MKYSIENLGVAGYGSANDDWASCSFAVHPETGEEIIIHSTLEFGIVWIDVKTGRSAHLVPEDPIVTLISRRRLLPGVNPRRVHLLGNTRRLRIITMPLNASSARLVGSGTSWKL